MYRYLLAAIFLLPNIAFASASFSEVAWMGTQNSSSDEWIELYNDGSEAISLSGYTIISTDEKLKINLKGEIKPNSYFLIERTDDSSVPNIQADLIASFGSGLSNTGETLRILDESGAVVDEIISGNDWKNIGGNSDTKDTPQKIDGVWVTATPTPKAIGISNSNIDQTQFQEENKTTYSSGKNVSILKSKSNLSLNIFYENAVVKDSAKKFSAILYDTNGDVIKNADIRWNFGDGAVGKGNIIEHTYRFDGAYNLVVFAFYYDKKVEEKIKINVLNQDIKIIEEKSGNDGYIKLKSNIDVDISNYSISGNGTKYIFPPGTYIYAKTPVVFANMYTGIIDHNTLVLENDNKKIIFVLSNEKLVQSLNYSYVAKSEPVPAVEDSVSTTSMLSTALKEDNGIPIWIYWAISGFFIVVLAVIIFASKVFNKDREMEDEAKKYTLVEIDSNLE